MLIIADVSERIIRVALLQKNWGVSASKKSLLGLNLKFQTMYAYLANTGGKSGQA